jgi:hypothetical protein
MAFFGILQRLAGVEGVYGLREAATNVKFASYINQQFCPNAENGCKNSCETDSESRCEANNQTDDNETDSS